MGERKESNEKHVLERHREGVKSRWREERWR